MNEAEELLAHVAAALALHSRRLRSEGIPVPPALPLVAQWIADCVSARHDATGLDRLVGALDGGRMDRLLLSRQDTAAALGGVSLRSVDRLIEAGELTAVKVGGATRIRRADLDAYVAGLGARSFRDDVTSKGAA